MMKILFLSSTILFVCLITAYANADRLDFSTTDSMTKTCKSISKVNVRSLKDDNSKVAYAVCEAMELTKYIWGLRGLAEGGVDGLSRLKGELSYILDKIESNRSLLEKIKLRGSSLIINPGNWEVDINNDGVVNDFERYFFRVPKKGVEIPRGGSRSSDFYDTYFENTKVKIDQSDIYWAIAYCYIGEAVIHVILSYDISNSNGKNTIQIVDRGRISTKAYNSAIKAIEYSKKLRETLLKESDNDLEWIPNYQQNDTEFPITMDRQLFQTWGDVLAQLEKLFNGKTLLGGRVISGNGRINRDLTGGLCGEGEGINIKQLFKDPINIFDDGQDSFKSRCVKASGTTPISKILQTLNDVSERNSNELSIARYLYWIN